MINFIESVLRRLQAPIQAAQLLQSHQIQDKVVVSAFEFRISKSNHKLTIHFF